MQSRETIVPNEARDMLDDIRSEAARRMSSAPEQYTNMMREAEAENHKIKQRLIEQQHETDNMKLGLCSHMQASQGTAATASDDVSAVKSSIAKQGSAYPSVCGVSVVERAGRASDADQAQTMRRTHEEEKYFRNELFEAKVDNERLIYNMKETNADCREEQRRRFFPTTARRGISPGSPERGREARACAR